MEHEVDENCYKWIEIFKNGDPYSPPIRFLVNRKQCKNYDSFLTFLTLRLRPTFGAVRRLFTSHGRTVSDLSELKSNDKYVAAGYDKFRRLSYERPLYKNRHRPQTEIKPVKHSRIKVPSRYKSAIENFVALTIFVYHNGDDITPARIVPLSKKDMQTWDLILRRIGERLFFSSTGDVNKLFGINGRLVIDYTELQNGKSYVAVIGQDLFRSASYGSYSPPLTRKFVPWCHGRSMREICEIQELNTFSTYSTSESGRMIPYHLLNEQEKQKGIFTVKEKPAYRTFKEIDYDKDDGGVYRARSSIKDVAHEIHDSEETSVDLPVDIRKAEEIKDEEISTRLRNTRLELDGNIETSLDKMSADEPSVVIEVDNEGNVKFQKENKWKQLLKDSTTSAISNSPRSERNPSSVINSTWMDCEQNNWNQLIDKTGKTYFGDVNLSTSRSQKRQRTNPIDLSPNLQNKFTMKIDSPGRSPQNLTNGLFRDEVDSLRHLMKSVSVNSYAVNQELANFKNVYTDELHSKDDSSIDATLNISTSSLKEKQDKAAFHEKSHLIAKKLLYVNDELSPTSSCNSEKSKGSFREDITDHLLTFETSERSPRYSTTESQASELISKEITLPLQQSSNDSLFTTSAIAADKEEESNSSTRSNSARDNFCATSVTTNDNFSTTFTLPHVSNEIELFDKSSDTSLSTSLSLQTDSEFDYFVTFEDSTYITDRSSVSFLDVASTGRHVATSFNQ